MTRVVITGTPGTGKSQISRLLARKTSLALIEIKEFVNKNRLFKMDGKEKVVDVAKLRKRLLPELSHLPGYVVEGHLACEFRIPADFVFVLRTNPRTLKRRLATRRYARKKLDENLEAEMLDYCVQRAEREYREKPLQLDTTKRNAASSARRMLLAIKRKEKKLDAPDYSKELESFLRLRPWATKRKRG